MPNLRGKTWTTTTPANVEDAQYWEDHLISDTAAAKAASSVQSVNSITPDQYGNVEIGNAGHTIQDDDGNDMPKQDVLQFVNADVTNDTVNEKTVVDCKGAKGDAATITVGTVTTLPAGSSATVTNSGTTSAAVFDFGIPKGADGTGSVDSVNGYTGTVVLDASDVGALPDSTTIPTKTSELDNDSGFVTSSAIPTSLSELSDDSTHRLVTDAEKTAWDAKVSESLLKDTVGWVGKNKWDYDLDSLKHGNNTGTWSGNAYTFRGITFTVNTNNSIKINGTNDNTNYSDFVLIGNNTSGERPLIADYLNNGDRFSCGVNIDTSKMAVGVWYYDNNETYLSLQQIANNEKELTISIPQNAVYFIPYIRVYKNQTLDNLIVYPMLRDASITDSTFEPYHKSVEDWYWENNPNAGAKNAVSFDNIFSNGQYATITEKGKVVEVKTTSAASWIQFQFKIKVKSNKDYRVSSNVTYVSGVGRIMVSTADNVTVLYNSDSITSNTSISDVFNTANETEVIVKLACSLNDSVIGDVIYNNLMIYDARDTDSTYQPYAMTNRELTEKVTIQDLDNALEITTGVGTKSSVNNFIKKYGNMLFFMVRIDGATIAGYTTLFRIKNVNLIAPNCNILARKAGSTITGGSLENDGNDLVFKPWDTLNNETFYTFPMTILIK